jgi:hypothetical protein
MKKVAIVNGIVRQAKYNKFLAEKYRELGFEIKEYTFPRAFLFSCHLHGHLKNETKEIVENHDVIHCQSSGFFPILDYYATNNHRKPFVFETPVLKSSTGTLFSALSWAKSYEHVPDNKIIQKILDTFCFSAEWVIKTKQQLKDLHHQRLSLVLASKSDNVSDNRGNEDLVHLNFDQGKHARLFFDNDFGVIRDFLKSHPHSPLTSSSH